MDKQTRLRRIFALPPVNRPPIFGWLTAPDRIEALTGCTEDAYWRDPFHWGMAPEHILGSDGISGIITPIHRPSRQGALPGQSDGSLLPPDIPLANIRPYWQTILEG